MSFSPGGAIMRNTVKIGALANQMTVGAQEVMVQVAEDGLHYMRSITPVDTTALVSSEESGTNQHSIWFRAAAEPQGDGKPYGLAQNYGWHDRGGGVHEGRYFMERTQIYARTRLLQLLAASFHESGSLGEGRALGLRRDPGLILLAISKVVKAPLGTHDFGTEQPHNPNR